MKTDYPIRQIPAVLILLFVASACATTGNERPASSDEVHVDNPDIPLIDYMRQIPRLRITTSGGEPQIMVRGASTFVGETSPLYVVNGSSRGHSFSDIESSVPVSEIESIRVLRGSEAMQRYGMRASNGAIVIRLKRK